jgi:flagellar motor switch/type III secretory pathway protein FliN
MAAQAQGLERPSGEAEKNSQLQPGDEIREEARWNPVLDLRCEFTVDLALPNFKIADLLKLRPGLVIDAHWRVGRDVPLSLNGTLIGWIEFEVVASNLAVRLTELA